MNKKSNLLHNIKKQGEESYKKKDESGINFSFYLNIKGNGLMRFPDELNSDYVIDILPFEIETNKFPVKGKKGDITYRMVLWVHKGIGLEKENFICMEKNYGESCECCKEFKKLQSEGYPYNDINNLVAKKRHVYNIKWNGKLYIFDTSFRIFEALWYQKILSLRKKGVDVFPIYMEEKGCKSLEFSTINQRGIGQYINFDFCDIENFDEEILKETVSLEKLIIFPDQEKIRKILNGTEDQKDNNQDEEKIKEKYENKISKEDIEYMKKAENIDITDVDIIGIDEEETEEKYENEKKKKKKVKNKIIACPHGLILGEDWDEYENCNSCEDDNKKIYDICREKQVKESEEK